MNSKIMLVAVLIVATIGIGSAFSEDYQNGYKAGCDLYGSMMAMDGLLDGTYITISTLDTTIGDPAIDSFLAAFVASLSVTYNEKVADYNSLVDEVNDITEAVLDDDAEDYLIEYQPYYR